MFSRKNFEIHKEDLKLQVSNIKINDKISPLLKYENTVIYDMFKDIPENIKSKVLNEEKIFTNIFNLFLFGNIPLETGLGFSKFKIFGGKVVEVG